MVFKVIDRFYLALGIFECQKYRNNSPKPVNKSKKDVENQNPMIPYVLGI